MVRRKSRQLGVYSVLVFGHSYRRQGILTLSAVEFTHIQPAQEPFIPGRDRGRQYTRGRNDEGVPGGHDRSHGHRQVGPRIHQVPDTDRGQARIGAVDIGQTQRVPELVIKGRGDTAGKVVLVGGLGNDRTFAQLARPAVGATAWTGQVDGLAQGHEKGGDVVGRIPVDITLPVAARMNEDDVGKGRVVVVVAQVDAAVGLGLLVRLADRVLHQAFQAIQGPEVTRPRAVVRDIGQLVASLAVVRQDPAFDMQPSPRHGPVIFRKTLQVGLEKCLVPGRGIHLQRLGIGQRFQDKIPAGIDRGQMGIPIGLESDPDDENIQGIQPGLGFGR